MLVEPCSISLLKTARKLSLHAINIDKSMVKKMEKMS